MLNSDFIIESRLIDFVASDTVVVTFEKLHYHVPRISMLPTSDINIKIRGLTITECQIETSIAFTGKVHMQAISKKV